MACLATFSKFVHRSLFLLNCSATELEIQCKVLVVVQGNIYLAICLRPLFSLWLLLFWWAVLYFTLLILTVSINQSINQSNFYSANISGVARLSGATSKSVLNSKIVEVVPQCQQVIGHAGVYGGKARSKRYVLRYFLKGATEVDERTVARRTINRAV